VIEAAEERNTDLTNAIVSAGWFAAALQRVRRIPSLSRLIRKRRRKSEQMTPEQEAQRQVEYLRALGAKVKVGHE
jgi:hypothetical protein